MSHARPALDIIAELRRGRVAAELTDVIAEGIQAAQDTGKKATVTLTLTFDPKKVGEYETPQIQVTDLISTKKPRRSVMPSTFFLTDDGAPVRRDPNQDEFHGIRQVPSPAADSSTTDRKAN